MSPLVGTVSPYPSDRPGIFMMSVPGRIRQAVRPDEDILATTELVSTDPAVQLRAPVAVTVEVAALR